MADEFYAGRRLCFENAPCTVRYHGPIKGTSGDWLGVEWDDVSRGKHHGTHRGVRYFECKSNASTAASFVRPSRPRDDPRTFLQALHSKYAGDSDPSRSAPDDSESFIKISGKEAEEVGFEKIRKKLANFQQLRILILDNQRIGGVDGIQPWKDSLEEAPIADVCPNVVELDVSRNLFERWGDIVAISCQLPALSVLRVEGNRFRIVSEASLPTALSSNAFINITTLSLDDTLLDQGDVSCIISTMPKLLGLSLSGNEYGTLRSVEFPRTLTSLTLERNFFSNLNDIGAVTQLPLLERLGLKANSIWLTGEVAFGSTLRDVDLSYNSIDDWKVIDRLGTSFPGLQSLVVSHNPLFEKLVSASGATLTAEDGYMLTVARVGALSRLNYSTVTPKERLNAETYYLSQVAQQLSNVTEARNRHEILACNARYSELCATYGEPAVARKPTTAIDPKSLAASLVNIAFVLDSSVSAKAPTAQREWHRELPRRCTIYTILGLVGKRIGLAPMSLDLVLCAGGAHDAPAEQSGRRPDGRDSSEQGVSHEAGADKLADEVLTPRIRTLGTWVEGQRATVRVRLSAGG